MRRAALRFPLAALCLAVLASHLRAQSCETSGEIEAARMASIQASAKRYFDLAAAGDLAVMQASAAAGAAAEFPPITSATFEKFPAGSKSSLRETFLLEADAEAVIPRAEFLCGTFSKTGQTANSAVFVLTNLRPGTYAVVIFDLESGTRASQPATLALIVEGAPEIAPEIAPPKLQDGIKHDAKQGDWLAAAFLRPARIAGHDAEWLAARAKEFRDQGQRHNAWLYYRAARNLASALPFMSTALTDKLYDDAQAAQPAGFPTDTKPREDFAAGATHYTLTSVTAEDVGGDLDLVVRYEASDGSDASKGYAQNVALIRALVGKFPELRGAFTGVVARAVTPAGNDYGTLLAMKNVR
jgi:hypothetical protein